MPDGPVAVQEMEWQRRVTPKEGANVGERKKAKKDEALEVAQRWRGGFHDAEEVSYNEAWHSEIQ